jgi:hypothetical protein
MPISYRAVPRGTGIVSPIGDLARRPIPSIYQSSQWLARANSSISRRAWAQSVSQTARSAITRERVGWNKETTPYHICARNPDVNLREPTS